MKNKRNAIVFILLLVGSLVSCTTTHRSIVPAAEQNNKWVYGRQVQTDTSRNLKADCYVHQMNPTVQFMLHIVNKGMQAILIDPSAIFTIQTNQSDNTYMIPCRNVFASSSDNNKNDEAVDAAVAIGLLAILVTAAVISSKSEKTNRSTSVDANKKEENSTSYHNRRKSHNENCNKEDRNNYSTSEATSAQSIPNTLSKHTLEPGTEVSGLVEVGLINDIKHLVLVVPGVDTSDRVKFRYLVKEEMSK